jgi:hypothetical protein
MGLPEAHEPHCTFRQVKRGSKMDGIVSKICQGGTWQLAIRSEADTRRPAPSGCDEGEQRRFPAYAASC